MSVSIDLQFLGHPQVITTAVLAGGSGVALIDPGPSTCVEALEWGLRAEGLSLSDVRAILLTHIHLDHCGGTGTILSAHPAIEVYVHERGAPHLADPTKLIASATRLYKDDMARLWGAILPVPARQIRAIGERLDVPVAGRTLQAIWTPGHASHHVCYLDESEKTAYVGDTAGMCRPGHTEVVPPALPPELDLVAWRQSTDRLLAWRPQTLFLTHFGPRHDAAQHIDRLWRRLDDWRGRVEASLAQPGSDDERAEAFSVAVAEDLARRSTPEDARAHALAAPFALCWHGFARYLRKRQLAATS